MNDYKISFMDAFGDDFCLEAKYICAKNVEEAIKILRARFELDTDHAKVYIKDVIKL